MPNIKDLYDSIPGLKRDFATNWKEDAKAEWKIDWDAQAGGGEAAPVNTLAPVLSGTAQVGKTLSVTTGTWTGYPAPTYSYEWFADEVLIPGADEATLLLTEDELGAIITVDVTATNVAGIATESSNASAAVIAAD